MNDFQVGQKVKISNALSKQYGIVANCVEVVKPRNKYGNITVKLPNQDEMEIYHKSLTIYKEEEPKVKQEKPRGQSIVSGITCTCPGKYCPAHGIRKD